MAAICPNVRSGLQRWLIFNSVGAIGIVVQMIVLFALTHCANVGYLVATVVAVESAVVHNFLWHERWTWADRITGDRSFLSRFIAFHLANGVLSLGGNLILMRFFVGKLGMNFMCANALAIAICSLLNFLAGDRLVFRKSRPHLSAKET